MSWFIKMFIHAFDIYKVIFTNKKYRKLMIIIIIIIMCFGNILNDFKESYYAGTKQGFIL